MSAIAYIAMAYGVQFVRRPDDASLVTNRPLERDEALALVRTLRAAGHEADDAPDHKDRGAAWVYLTEAT